MPHIDMASVAFAVEDGDLVLRAVARTSGRPYRHACPLASLEAVAHEVDAAGPMGVTREDLHARTGAAWTRINVALLFLYERSIVGRTGKRGRLCVAASPGVHLDAMTEYHALREGAPGSAAGGGGE